MKTTQQEDCVILYHEYMIDLPFYCEPISVYNHDIKCSINELIGKFQPTGKMICGRISQQQADEFIDNMYAKYDLNNLDKREQLITAKMQSDLSGDIKFLKMHHDDEYENAHSFCGLLPDPTFEQIMKSFVDFLKSSPL